MQTPEEEDFNHVVYCDNEFNLRKDLLVELSDAGWTIALSLTPTRFPKPISACSGTHRSTCLSLFMVRFSFSAEIAKIMKTSCSKGRARSPMPWHTSKTLLRKLSSIVRRQAQKVLKQKQRDQMFV